MKNSFWGFAAAVLMMLVSPMPASAQDDTKKSAAEITQSLAQSLVDTPAPQEPAVEKPSNWKKGILTQLSFSQTALSNWTAGGNGNATLNGYADATADYAKDKFVWENRLQFGYGFTYTFSDDEKYPYRKSDDRIQIDSKMGHLVSDRLYVSGLFYFKTQLTPGYNYSSTQKDMISNFLAPAYLNLGAGIDYKPAQFLSLYFSPVTGNFVIVAPNDSVMRASFGNKKDEAVRTQLGAQLKLDFRYAYQSFNINSQLTLFSNYLKNPQNIQVSWDLSASIQIIKYLTLTLRTNLIYDDNVKIANAAGEKSPKIQFKEIGGIGFTYTFGDYTKK